MSIFWVIHSNKKIQEQGICLIISYPEKIQKFQWFYEGSEVEEFFTFFIRIKTKFS